VFSRDSPAQNNRSAEAGRVCWRSPSPTALLKRGQLQQSAQDWVRTRLDYLPAWRLPSFAQQPLPGLNHTYSKNTFSDIQMALAVFQSAPVALHRAAGLRKGWLHRLYTLPEDKRHAHPADQRNQKSSRRTLARQAAPSTTEPTHTPRAARPARGNAVACSSHTSNPLSTSADSCVDPQQMLTESINFARRTSTLCVRLTQKGKHL